MQLLWPPHPTPGSDHSATGLLSGAFLFGGVTLHPLFTRPKCPSVSDSPFPPCPSDIAGRLVSPVRPTRVVWPWPSPPRPSPRAVARPLASGLGRTPSTSRAVLRLIWKFRGGSGPSPRKAPRARFTSGLCKGPTPSQEEEQRLGPRAVWGSDSARFSRPPLSITASHGHRNSQLFGMGANVPM